MIISIVNTKGGVGKTVTAVNLGAALAAQGKRVLLLDVDLQGGLSQYLGADVSGATTADVLSGGAGIEEATQQVRPNLFLIPATASMEGAEVELSGASGGEVRLRRAFKRWAQFRRGAELPDYDFVFIDCPSGWGAVTRNALLASNAIIVPVNSEPAAVFNAVSTVASARELGEYHDHEILLLGVLLTRFRSTNAAKFIEEQAHETWGDLVFGSKIRQAERINELAMSQETLSDVGAKASGPVGADYAALAREVCERSSHQ